MSTDVPSCLAQDRFRKHFDNTIRWGSGKVIDQSSSPAEAFENANYLMFPASRRNYLCLDLDWEGAAAAWMDEGLPEPTIAFVNQKNSHGNLAYELSRPVYWPCKYNFHKVKFSPVNYFKAIKRGYEAKLFADSGYTNASIKNPFSSEWKVYWSDETYSLNYLAEFVDLENIFYKNRFDEDKIYAGRNEELFCIARHYSCMNIKKYNSYDKYKNELLGYLLLQNDTVIPENWASKGPLDIKEVSVIASNVSRYMWKIKDYKKYKYIFKNYGVMNLDPIQPGVSSDDRKNIIKNRQSLGAKYVHDIRRSNTLEAIYGAINKLIANNKKLNYNKISIESGIGYKTVLKYKSQIISFKNSVLMSKS